MTEAEGKPEPEFTFDPCPICQEDEKLRVLRQYRTLGARLLRNVKEFEAISNTLRAWTQAIDKHHAKCPRCELLVGTEHLATQLIPQARGEAVCELCNAELRVKA